MNAKGSQVAQVRPAHTSNATAFTATIHTEITAIVVANVWARLRPSGFHDDDGVTFDQDTALFYDVSLSGGQSTIISDASPSSMIQVKDGGSIGVRSSVASALTFTFYGVTADRTPMR